MAAASQTSDNNFNDLWKYSAGEWTWIGGSNGYNQAGIYGSQGVAAPGNVPGARSSTASWKDGSGKLWLFGGLGLDSTGSSQLLNDLWNYNAGEWTWVSGESVALPNQPGIYGTQGTAALGNIPGARSGAVSWTDAAGNFWLFGGLGWDSTGKIGNLNDLWRYSAGEWAWMAGANVVNQPGTYGTQGTSALSNTPGARLEAVGWTDSAGSLWLFGGTSGQQTFQPMNDLWKYSGGQWTWIGGSQVPYQPGVYGTQGNPSLTNIPGARVSALAWVDMAGNMWLFGGNGYDSTDHLDLLNDLWKYSAGQWTWVRGSNLASQVGTYETLGAAAATSTPGARFQAAGWTDASGSLWLFGGAGYAAGGGLSFLNDLWKYQP
jgi:N-acetylneuraminic acid mutarotase